MQYPINKEIRYYEEEIFLGLNLRQLLCSGVAIAVAVVVYLLLEPLIGRETAGWVCIVTAAPLAAAGFFVYDDLTFEFFLLAMFESTVLGGSWRIWESDNLYSHSRKPKQEKAPEKKGETPCA